MLRLTAILIFVVSLLPLAPAAAQEQRGRTVIIGIVTDGTYERYRDLLDLFRNEAIELLSIDFDVRLPSEKLREGDWTLAGVESAIEQQLNDPEVDLVLTLGAISSHVAAQRRDLAKPVVTPIIIDAELQELPREGGGSGVRNLNYVALPRGRDILAFQEIVAFRRIALLVNGPLAEAIPQLSEKARAATQAIGLEPVIIPVGFSVDSVLAAVEDESVEAVYILPQLQLSTADWDRLVRGLSDLRLPSFSWFGRREVVDGVLAARRPDRFWQRLARRVALNIQGIVLGEEPSTLPVAFAEQEHLTINMATARAIGVFPPWKVMTEAELIAEEERVAARRLTLERAVREAVEVNLDLAAVDRFVAAGAQEVNVARAVLLPQIDIGATWRLIDEDQAENSFGSQPERLFAGSATLTQVLFNEPAWANLSAQGSLQRAREQERESLRLDIAFDAAFAYLNVLKAKTFERIERENLKVTRENLELAEIRESIGTAGAGEVYRWQAQIANNRQTVIDANSQRNQAEIVLNRILRRPLEEGFATQETEIADAALISGQPRLYSYIDNLWSFRIFRRFMAQEALQASPEIRALDALAAAQRRTLQSTSRSFWLPSLALQAGVDNAFDRSGAGSEPPAGFPLELEDLSWSLGVKVSYPLFTGAGRIAERKRAKELLSQIQLERDAVAQRVEQRVRSALHAMGASLANIDLSEEAADASENNFRLVQESYSRGAASIIQLLDAQNAARVSEQLAASAVYDFLIDLMTVERAVGRFDFFVGEEEREAFFQRLEMFYQEAGDTAAGG
ncbi:MAG: TolC family protein [Gemmatimonadota bacterium]|nr:MAG: TolC family protein [Gemmatimonadota bacterium]